MNADCGEHPNWAYAATAFDARLWGPGAVAPNAPGVPIVCR